MPTRTDVSPRPLRHAALALAALLVLTACGRYEPPTPEPVEAADVVGHWSPDGDASGAFLALRSDGTVLGGPDGCNLFGATETWAVEGGRVTFEGARAWTDRGCAAGDPEDRWVGNSRALVPDGDDLVALDGTGAELGRLRAHDGRPSRDDLVGTWRADGGVALVLSADGDAGGSDGCNAFGGETWEVAGDRVVLAGQRVTTLRGCPDVDARFGMTTGLRWELGELVGLDEDGAETGRLRRVP